MENTFALLVLKISDVPKYHTCLQVNDDASFSFLYLFFTRRLLATYEILKLLAPSPDQRKNYEEVSLFWHTAHP